MRSRRTLMLVAAAGTIPLRHPRAAGFPDRTITFVVPWGPGGSNDILARELQPLLRDQGVNIVVENEVGAIGLRRVATALPDGYMLGMGTSSTMAYMAQGKTPLRNADFTPIARVSTDPLLLLVLGEGASKSLEDFFALANARRGALFIGTPGAFNLNHIFAAMAARAA